MRFIFYLTFIGIVIWVLQKVFLLFIQGKLFEPGALKESFRESGKTLWLGMKLFVILWFLYLLFVWWVRTRNG